MPFYYLKNTKWFMIKKVLNDYSWVLAGSQRIKVVKALIKPMTPKMLSKETNLKFSNVSDCLRALVQRKLAKCLNPKKHLGRLYELTAKGKEVQKEI